jgi:hypothetical protein
MVLKLFFTITIYHKDRSFLQVLRGEEGKEFSKSVYAFYMSSKFTLPVLCHINDVFLPYRKILYI